jgi:hypothetical protein
MGKEIGHIDLKATCCSHLQAEAVGLCQFQSGPRLVEITGILEVIVRVNLQDAKKCIHLGKQA